MSVNENKLSKYPIQMTSNNTPEPFLIDNVENSSGHGSSPITNVYKMFDNINLSSTNSQYCYYLNQSDSVSFNITLDKKILLNKISIIYIPYRCYIKSFSLYGINDDNTETLITTQGQSGIESPYNFEINNDIFYKKYKIIINNSSWGGGGSIYIQEIELFYHGSSLLFHDNQFYGLDDDNNLMSFDDINSYNNYTINIDLLNQLLKDSKVKYPFKVIKLIK